MDFVDEPRLERLDAYWDAVVRGEPEPGAIDPALADALARLRALDDADGPRAEFVAQLRQQLSRQRAALPSPNGHHKEVSAMHATPLAVSFPPGARPRAMSAPMLRRRHPVPRWAGRVGTFLSAALILLVIAAGFTGLLRRSPDGTGSSGPMAAIPAVQASPSPAADESVELAFPGLVLPAGDVAAFMEFYEVLPHEGGDYTLTGNAAVILMVRSGTMAISGELAGLHRAGAEPAAASPAPGETILGPGDAAALVFTSDQVYPIRNAGDDKLFFVEAVVSNLNMGASQPTLGLDQAEYTMMPKATTLTADSAVTARLTRATLAPDESRAPADGGWQLAIGDPGRMTRSPIDGTVHNVSDQPHEVFILTATFTPATATPAP